MDEPKTAVKDTCSPEELIIYANYVREAFDAIFKVSTPPEIVNHGNSVSMMFFDMALLYIKHNDRGSVICVLSYFDECDIAVGAEFCCLLKDIFKHHVLINDETFIPNPTGSELIWGRDNIDTHNERAWGRKIHHSIMFDDTMAGHS